MSKEIRDLENDILNHLESIKSEFVTGIVDIELARSMFSMLEDMYKKLKELE